MTVTQIKERLDKAIKRKEAKLNTIAKKTTWINSGKKDELDCKWLNDDIRRLTKEISEIDVLIDKYNKQLAGELEKEEIFKDIPQVLYTLAEQLVESWTDYDINRRNYLKARWDELGRKEFWRIYSATDYNLMNASDDLIHKNNEQDADTAIKHLFVRVREITGNITSWSNITCGGGGNLNGIVIGEAGRAKVSTIAAGGYNIQRLHLRTLVTSI